MTGYGKAECVLSDGKITIEVRSLNGKSADISIKSQIIPREKELEIRQLIAKELYRGNIDLFASFEPNATESAKVINKELFTAYYKQILDLNESIRNAQKDYISTKAPLEDWAGNKVIDCDRTALLPTILKFPDVIETKKQELTEESFNSIFGAVKEALKAINQFRSKEGEILYNDMSQRVINIENYIIEVEKYEQARITAVKERIRSRIDELNINPDENRLEQEIIFYIEKLDINEEKVRLRQHCKYFIETMKNEENPGKKLGFIAQEMGREINTMGSKSNQADMQQVVVRMKDELEKIKEQTLNTL